MRLIQIFISILTITTSFAQTGVITGQVVSFPKSSDSIGTIYLRLNNKDKVVASLHNKEVFAIKKLQKKTYHLKISSGDNTYPIWIKNINMINNVVDLGIIPLFIEPFGYYAEWGETSKGKRYYNKFPAYGVNRDSLESIYKKTFLKLNNSYDFEFKTIEIDYDPSKNISEQRRFLMISLK